MLEVQHFPMLFALIASHHPFGFYKRFILITVLRAPYRRVLGILPSPQSFEDMFRHE